MQTLEAELMQSNNINYTLTQKGKAYRWLRRPRVKTRSCPTHVNKSNGAKAEKLQSKKQARFRNIDQKINKKKCLEQSHKVQQ